MIRCLVLSVIVAVMISGSLHANDTGVFEHFLNINATLPAFDEAISPEDAVLAVKDHITGILSAENSYGPGMDEYWADYRAVLKKYPDIASAKPVTVHTANGVLVARYLVGLQVNGAVGGFFAVSPVDGSIQAEMTWDSNLKPLWVLPRSQWEKAESVNEIDTLAELIPPYEQFTTGIPVDPHDPSLFIVDGVVDNLAQKNQEERAQRIDWLNNEYGTNLKASLASHSGRRTGTSKCMSVAASYLADWWTVMSSRELPVYTNPVGGQKEYGFNPRLLECKFFERAADNRLLAKYIGNFKVGPMSKDRVTGEKIAYSPRGYARILVETNAGTVKDNLLPDVVSYETNDNHFAMDQPPHIAQIFIDGFFPKRAIKKDLSNAKDRDFPFTLMKDYGARVDVSYISDMLKTWGPLYGQHMGRNKDGSPKTGRFGMGLHCVMVIGTGEINGREMLIYKETFGHGSRDYLEDSIAGPSYRAMPIEFFYQAIAFPHHLYVAAGEFRTAEDASLTGTFTVTTNGGKDLVDVDQVNVYVDGELSPHSRVKSTEKGTYSLWLPVSTHKASEITIEVSKKYFATSTGEKCFSVQLVKSGRKWVTP